MMIDYALVVADALLAVVTAVGVYYSLKARGLFNGDVMQRTFEVTAGAFTFLALFSVLDLILKVTNPESQIPLVRYATLVTVGSIVVAQILFIRWASSPEKP
jgi:uncharacterized PurR-regulated membrane protein YhhQ (DUF165 family)